MAARTRRTSPLQIWTLIGVLLAACLAIFTHDAIDIGWLGAWLVGINLATLIMLGIDKLKAQRGWLRIPENVLLLMVLIGGPAGALVGMPLFRHKISKGSFQNAFRTIIILQIVVLCLWYLIVS